MNAPQPPNPFADRPEAPPRRWSAKGWLWLLIGIWGGLAVMLLACGGFGYFTVSNSESVLEKLVLDELHQHPIVAQHLGQIESVKVIPKSPLDPRPDAAEQPDFIVTAEGSKARGFLWMYQSRSPRTEGYFGKIDLHLPGGEKVSVK
jgi:hypothetical protein